ncbi:hypothetical protein Tco_1369168 [Tanacetum coccineum]
MATLKFADSHNMVAFWSKPAESEGFEQIVDFLNAHPIRYGLTVNPTIYVSCIEQFWSSIVAKTINGEVQLHALVDGKRIIITETFVRRSLRLANAEGIDCFSNSTFFENLALMGPKKTAWNEFSSTMTSAIICLATNQKFNFSKLIFDSMVRNLDNLSGKILIFFKCLQFELPEDVINKTLQIILELQSFKPSLFDLCSNYSSKLFSNPSYQQSNHIVSDYSHHFQLAIYSGVVSPLATRKWWKRSSSKKAETELEEYLKKDESEVMEGSSKRVGEKLEQEATKKQKVDDVQETAEVDDDQEIAKIKELMEIVPDKEEVAIDAIPLAVKPPNIVDGKIHKEEKKTYYQIIRADGSSNMYLVFSHIHKSFDGEDLETLWKLGRIVWIKRLLDDLKVTAAQIEENIRSSTTACASVNVAVYHSYYCSKIKMLKEFYCLKKDKDEERIRLFGVKITYVQISGEHEQLGQMIDSSSTPLMLRFYRVGRRSRRARYTKMLTFFGINRHHLVDMEASGREASSKWIQVFLTVNPLLGSKSPLAPPSSLASYGSGAISWASKKQTCITGSTMESEFVALAAAGKEAKCAITLVKAYSQMYNGKSRHLGVRHSMIRELITNGVVSIEFVRSQQNLADHLTKGLARDLVL